ncbi:hypothetical protein ACLOJK_020275 [Asimina triloba]
MSVVLALRQSIKSFLIIGRRVPNFCGLESLLSPSSAAAAEAAVKTLNPFFVSLFFFSSRSLSSGSKFRRWRLRLQFNLLPFYSVEKPPLSPASENHQFSLLQDALGLRFFVLANARNASPFCGLDAHFSSSPSYHVFDIDIAAQNQTTSASNQSIIKCRRRAVVVAKAVGENPESSSLSVVNTVKNVWDKAEDRYALAGLGFATVVALWASSNLIGVTILTPCILKQVALA